MGSHHTPSLPAANVFVVLGCGALTVLAMTALGVVRFYQDSAADLDPIGTQGAVFAFLLSMAVISLFFLIVAGAAAWVSGRAVRGDVDFVTRRVRAIAERGDLGEPVAIRTLDEVGELTRAFEALRQAYLEQLARDRDARKRALDADLLKTEFLNTVSHELRTPLNSILGFTEVLLSEIEGPLSAAQREDLQTIQTSGEHLLDLFNKVLDLSALVSGRIDLSLEDAVLEGLLEKAVAVMDGQRRGRPVELLLDVHGPLPPVRADRTRVMQVLFNLIGNALKFTEAGQVRVSAERSGDEVIVRVSDTGVGIESLALQQIFEHYAQTGTRERRRQGSGLGLSICKQLVTLHRGRLWAESTPGSGSTFSFSLPVVEEGV